MSSKTFLPFCHTIRHHTPENVAAGFSKYCYLSAKLYSTTQQKLWQQIPPKHRYPSTNVYGATPQKLRLHVPSELCYPSTELHSATPHKLKQQAPLKYCYPSTKLYTITPPENYNLTLSYTMLS